jgi:hypothetical protein
MTTPDAVMPPVARFHPILVNPGRAFRRTAWVLVAYLALTLVMTYPTITHFLSAIPGDSFDGWQNFWNLWWVRQAVLVEHRSPFFTDMLYYPTGVSLLFHTLNPFNGFTFLPVQLAAGLFAAYNSVVFFSFAVGGLGGYLLTRYTLRRTPEPARTWAAFLAGAIYTFSPFHFAHLLGHMQVLSLEWIPFYVLYLWRAVDHTQPTRVVATAIHQNTHPSSLVPRPSSPQGMWLPWRDTVLSAFFLILIGLCDWYFVLYCLLFTALVWLYLLWHRRLTMRVIAWTAAVGGLFALVLSPLLWPMILETRRFDFMVPPPEHVYILSADLLAFLTPNEFHPVWGQAAARLGAHLVSPVSEHTVFVGYVPLLLGLWGAWRGGYRRGFWALATLTFALLALGPALHVAGRQLPIPLPYALLQRLVPFIRITRSVSRFDAMVMLALGVLAAIGLAAIALAPPGGDAKGRRGGSPLQSIILSAFYLPWLRLRLLTQAGKGQVKGLKRDFCEGGALHATPKRTHLVALVAVALTLFEFLPMPYPVSPPDTPPWYAELAKEPGGFAVLNLPMNWDRPGYLLYQTVHGKRLTVAYISRNDPRTLAERVPVLQQLRHLGPDVITQDLGKIGRSVLAWLDVRYVVLDRYKMPGEQERTGTVRYATAALAGLGPITLAGTSYEDERLTVYRVEPPAEPQPFLILGTGWGDREMEGDTPWRRVSGEATLQIYTATPVIISFHAIARGEVAGTSLTVRAVTGDAVTHVLDVQPQGVEIGPLNLAPGTHTITISSSGLAWFTGLNLLLQ